MPNKKSNSNTSGRGSGRTTQASRKRYSDVRYEVSKTGRSDGSGYVDWQKYKVVNPGMKNETWRKVGKPVRRFGPSSR